MIKRIVLSVIVISVLIVSSIGCAVTEDTVTAAQFTPIATIVNRLAGEESTWNNYAPRITALEIRPTSTSTPTDVSGINSSISTLQSKVTTTEQDIAALKTSVKALQDIVSNQPVYNGGNQTGGTTGNIPGFTPGVPTGTIPTSPSGGVVSQVNWVQGTTQIWTSPTGNSQPIWYIQRLMNQSTAIQYVRPMITLGVSSQYGGYSSQTYFAGMDVNISSPQGSVLGKYVPPTAWAATVASANVTIPAGLPLSSISATSPNGSSFPFLAPVAPLTISMAPGLGQLTNSVMIMPIAGLSNSLGEFYISPGGYIDVTVMIQGLNTSTNALWNISASYSSHI